MASIKLKFSPSSKPDGMGRLFFQLIHRRTVRQINTDYHIHTHEWDVNGERIIAVGTDKKRDSELRMINEKVRWLTGKLCALTTKIVIEQPAITADELVQELEAYDREVKTVFEAFRDHIKMLEDQGRCTTAAHFRTALNSFSGFRQSEDLCFDSVDDRLCQDYEQYLRRSGLCRNTSSMYLRQLRVIFNMAVEEGLTGERKPFIHVYTGNDKTMKRALTFEEIRRVKHLDLTGNPHLQFARDMFLFSFYCRGMSLVDMAKLRKRDISNLKLTYIRSKTGMQLGIDWVEDMQKIVDRYSDKDSPYLLPLIAGDANDTKRPPHKSVGQALNRSLAKIAALAGMERSFTMYAARHTWATLARDSGTPLFVIKEGMGHGSIQTTQVYLASLNARLVDDANYRIIRSLD